MGEYHIADKAANDMAVIYDGMLERGISLTNVDVFFQELLNTLQNLADFPDIGTPRDYLPPPALAFPFKQYMIYYEKISEGVKIVQILFGRMDLEGHFAEKLDQ